MLLIDFSARWECYASVTCICQLLAPQSRSFQRWKLRCHRYFTTERGMIELSQRFSKVFSHNVILNDSYLCP